MCRGSITAAKKNGTRIFRTPPRRYLLHLAAGIYRVAAGIYCVAASIYCVAAARTHLIVSPLNISFKYCRRQDAARYAESFIY